MKKKVIYTCITGDYDDLIKHKYVNSDYDYVCFTDNKTLLKSKIKPWKILPLKYKESDKIRNARWHKTHPHILFPEYDISFWVDASIDILTNKLFNKFEDSSLELMTIIYNERNCIFQECDAVEYFKYDSTKSINRIREFLKSSKMPKNFGLAETGIMFRRHNIPQIIKINEDWWNMIKKYSHRDQLSFTYVLWKNGVAPNKNMFIPNERINPVNYIIKRHAVNKQLKIKHLFKKVIFPGRNRVHIYLFGIKVFSYKTKKQSI